MVLFAVRVAVELVRQKYGFVDEDEQERQRVKWVLQQQSKR